MDAVILAGGKGTRLHSITNDEIPKPMVPVAGKPILQHQIEALKANGINKIFIICGHLSEKIKDFFGNGANFGVTIEYFVETTPLGTAGAMGYLAEKLSDDFLLVFGDLIFDFNIAKMQANHVNTKADATLLVHPNNHPYDSDLVILAEDNKVVDFASKNQQRDYYYKNLVNSGIYILNTRMLKLIAPGEKQDLEKDILAPHCGPQGKIYGYISPEYVKDVGTPERLALGEEDILSGLVAQRNLRHKQKAIFLDRDGVINQYKGLLSDINDFSLENTAAQAIGKINRSGYLCIVATNQPVVARNLCGIEEVKNIHNKMETLLGEAGCYLDAIYFCPHHPDKGYPEENPAYKIDCHCRKPDIGMVAAAARDFNLDLSRSWFVGDTTVDIKTGQNAGLRTILVNTGEAGKDGKFAVQPDLSCQDILQAVESIIEKTGE